MFNQNNTKLNFNFLPKLVPACFLYLPFMGCDVSLAPEQPHVVCDFDLDGVPDRDDLDDDNDGILDEIETTTDLDGDKIVNLQDRDSDGDGIPDLIEATGVDKDGNGVLDPWDEWDDENRNGLHDEYEVEPLVTKNEQDGRKIWKSYNGFGLINLDQDEDGIPNFWDKDSDNDGLSDSEEVGFKSLLEELQDANADGFDDRLVGKIYTSGDKEGRSGHPEIGSGRLGLYVSTQPDGAAGLQNGIPDIDDNDNGIPDFLEKVD